MITRELLRSIRNDLPMRLTIARLGGHGPISKQSDGYFRFQCPGCKELRATVNPRNNLAHCFCCGENFNNIDLMMINGYDFIPAVEILEGWLRQYHKDRTSHRSPHRSHRRSQFDRHDGSQLDR